ncbi:hypothetical protein U1Q18_047586 [Sarracenia purpurea var. burkii]
MRRGAVVSGSTAVAMQRASMSRENGPEWGFGRERIMVWMVETQRGATVSGLTTERGGGFGSIERPILDRLNCARCICPSGSFKGPLARSSQADSTGEAGILSQVVSA